jgi:proline iminopeptidase
MPPAPVQSPLARESTVPIAGANLFVREIGSGPACFVLHGGPDFDHTYLLPELDRLASVARLVYYDQRGRGRSSAGVAPEDVTIESEIEDLDRLREHLGLVQAALLGHSWGGLLAMEYAARHPERVSHLVLMNAAPGSHEELRRFRSRRETEEGETLAAMRAIAARPDFAAGDVATEAEYYRAHFAGAARHPELVDEVVRRLRAHFTPADILKARGIEARLYEQTWNEPGYDVVDRLRGLTAPTLVLHGDHDLIPVECARQAADAVPGARLVVLEDCGHFSYLERPAEVFAEVAALLAR